MRYTYFICDVFTRERFGGNPLAVLPDARGLTDGQMQKITREFNFSESTFVLPPESGGTRRVRIFTPTKEIPFAGHPNVGTAFVLASANVLGELGDRTEVIFEELAGAVPVSIVRRDGRIWCELRAPETLSLGAATTPGMIAAAVSLAPGDVVTSTHAPQVASAGLPFLFAELRDRAALERARSRMTEWTRSSRRASTRTSSCTCGRGTTSTSAPGCSRRSTAFRRTRRRGARTARSRACWRSTTRAPRARSATGSPRGSRWAGRACSRRGWRRGTARSP